jgi:Derlin-2/3
MTLCKLHGASCSSGRRGALLTDGKRLSYASSRVFLLQVSLLVLVVTCARVRGAPFAGDPCLTSFGARRLKLQSSPSIFQSCSWTDKVVSARAPLSRQVLHRMVGGSLATDEGDEYDSEIDASNDEDFEYDEDSMMMDDFELLGDGDDMMYDESNLVQRASEMWQTTPPFTKAYMSASMFATAVGFVINKQTHEFPKFLLLDWKPTLFRGQIWRPITAFLNFGPLGFGYVMTAHFVWTYMSTLEKLHHDKPYDFWIMIAFGAASMLCGYSMLGISPRFLGHNLSTFLVYIWSRYHEGMEVNVMELFNARAETLPWFFLAQTAILEGELPLLDVLGIVFGHIYHHAKVSKMLVTPRALINWYNDPNHPLATRIRKQYKEISADFEMQ